MAASKQFTKTVGERLADLRASLLVLRDSLEAIKNRKLHFIIPIFGQLRALLVEKRRDNEPLLLDLATRFRIDPSIYWMPGSPEELSRATGIEPPVFYMGGFPMSLRKELPRQEPISINDLIKKEILFLKNSRYSIERVIKMCAEKAGGAHWAQRLTEDEKNILSFNIFLVGLQPTHQALAQFASVILEYGFFLLSTITTQHVHLFALIPDQTIRHKTYLFSFGYPNGTNTIRLAIGNQRVFQAEIMTFSGDALRLQCAPEFNHNQIHHFELSHELNRQFHSMLSLYIDGQLCGEIAAPFPILFDGRGIGMNGHLNVPAEKNVAEGIEMAIVDVLVRGMSTKDYARERLDTYFRAKGFSVEQPVVVLRRTSRAYKASRDRNFQFESPAEFTKLGAYLQSFEKKS